MSSVSIMGIHEPGGEEVLRLPTNGGVIVFTERVGHDPYDKGGRDYRPWSDQGYVPYVRLNNDYNPGGTIPSPADYDDFVVRIVNFIEASQGCQHWIIGNEMNHRVEWPHGDDIHAEDYIMCWGLIQDEMEFCFPGGHPHQLSPGAVAPWNTDSIPQDWVSYFAELMIGCRTIGFITMHAYTHGADPTLVTSDAKMDPPYDAYHYHFRTYRDFMSVIPGSLVGKEVIISETNQDAPWADVPGVYWMQEAYKEVVHWNYGVREDLIGGNIIRALCPYRWPRYDDRYIEGKTNVIADYHEAVEETEEGVPPVADWNRKFYLDCEGANHSAFFDQDRIPELTIPVGTELMWRWAAPEGQLNRPEADWKSAAVGHPEVYEGLWSCVVYDTWSSGQHWYLSDRIPVPKHALVRGDVAYMHVFAGLAVGGSQCGIVLGDGPFASGRTQWPVEWENPCDSPSITWGPWRTSRQGADHLPDREWAPLFASEVDTGEYTFIRLIVRAHADQRGELSAFHYDNFAVEVFTDNGVEPPLEPGECQVQALQDNIKVTALALAQSLRGVANALEQSVESWE